MKAELLNHKDIPKEAWDRFVITSPQGSFYCLSGYLDIISPGWQAIVYVKNGEMVAVMPLLVKKKFGLNYATQGVPAKYWGILLNLENFDNYYQEYSFKREVVQQMIKALPKNLISFTTSFHYNFDYFLPFYWNRFQLHPQYVYQLPLNTSEEIIFSNFRKSLRSKLRKVDEQFSCKKTRDASNLINLFKKQAENKKVLQKYQSRLQHLSAFLVEKNMGEIIEIYDEQDKIISATFFVHFGNITTLLFSGRNENPTYDGAKALNVWEGIKSAIAKSNLFDFAGSKIPGVENFIRGFGAKPVLFMMVSKNNLPLINIWKR